ncbi:amino acid transporter [Amycolatopsis bartoniae]|uniref:Amino acid permease n=1 Tax=Amycolatopsis bartoniae TaxID=941986 RepID=A0A8H9J0K9_9PSEU|nr:APC family permease [Amycolatopsis bartoniae]MBB2935106.1 amino acid transporter [Amycolatopsis bartoniae]TVT06987.1 APC family permease [Amycolatopsis bartoniae]GHF74394.1 amino acid permease [Amycolatopsis bartoniae]
MAERVQSATSGSGTRQLHRSVGFYGLMFVSLGSIIGSGWLLGALKAAKVAGPASLLSWILTAVIMATLALVHAELGAAYPMAGGTARFPALAYGVLGGFAGGWVAWLQAVALAPVEVEASLQYLDNITWVKQHLNLLHSGGSETLTASGFAWATVLMLVFTVINLVGVKLLSESNTATVIWKVAVPVLTVVVLLSLRFHPGNFSAGGGFAPSGAHGVFAALPVGVVFALQGFEQAVQLGGESRNPQKDISRAIITAMVIGTIVYLLLEIAFIGALDPASIVKNWDNPITQGSFGPYATLATLAGAGWLAYILYADAFVSPAGTGLLYLGTSSRISYAMGKERALPKQLGKLSVRGVPVWSIVLSFVVGEIMFLPFPSWQDLVEVITSATALMYAFAPVSMIALRKRDPERARPYRAPAGNVLAPAGFAAANLIIYWTGFDTTWKIMVAIVVGFVLFLIARATTKPADRLPVDWKAVAWVPVWLAGMVLIDWLGRYGDTGELKALPEWWDLLAVIVFSLVIFYWAVSLAVSGDKVRAAIERETEELVPERI